MKIKKSIGLLSAIVGCMLLSGISGKKTMAEVYNAAEYSINMQEEYATFLQDCYVALEKRDIAPRIDDFFSVQSNDAIDFSFLSCTADTYIFYCTKEQYDTAVNANERSISSAKKITLKAAPKKVSFDLNFESNNSSNDLIVKGVYNGSGSRAEKFKEDEGCLMMRFGGRSDWCPVYGTDNGSVITKGNYRYDYARVIKGLEKTGGTITYIYLAKSNQSSQDTFVRMTKIFRMKIAKQAKAPSIRQDINKAMLGIKSGMAYSLTGNEGDWTTVPEKDDKGKRINALSAYLVTRTTAGMAIGEGMEKGVPVFVKVNSTEKRPSSKVVRIFVKSISDIGAISKSVTYPTTTNPTAYSSSSSSVMPGVTIRTEKIVSPITIGRKYSCEAVLLTDAQVKEYDSRTLDFNALKWTKMKNEKGSETNFFIKYDGGLRDSSGNRILKQGAVILFRQKGFRDRKIGEYMPSKIYRIVLDETSSVETM